MTPSFLIFLQCMVPRERTLSGQPFCITNESHASRVPEDKGGIHISIWVSGKLELRSLHLVGLLPFSAIACQSAAIVSPLSKASKWSDLNSSLPDTEIKIWIPPPSSGTRDTWDSLVMQKGCPESMRSRGSMHCKKIRKDGVIRISGESDDRLVNRIATQPGINAVIGYSYSLRHANRVKPVAIEGVSPSLETIQNFSYPLSRPLFLYVKRSSLESVPAVRFYLEEYFSNAALSIDGYLNQIGLVPLSPEKIERERSKMRLLFSSK